METVISTTTSHKAESCDTWVRWPEHYASTLRTRALRSVISRMMSKCRTRQLDSRDTLTAFFRELLERGVRVQSPKGWCWHLVRALPLLSPGVSTQWVPGGVHMATDEKCVENLAGLSEDKVRSRVPKSRAVDSATCWSCRQLQGPWCSAEVRKWPRVSDRAGLHTTRTTG